MAANVQDAIVLLGDSLTQGGYELNGFAARLSRTSHCSPDCARLVADGITIERVYGNDIMMAVHRCV